MIKCSKCHRVKSQDQFNVQALLKGTGWCRDCRRAQSKRKKSKTKNVSDKEYVMLAKWKDIGYGSVERRGKATIHGFRT